jgi:uncharacterized protein YbjT (DUF2867 family)
LKAVVCGSTGLVGHLLLEKLLKDHRFSEVISVSRRKSGLESHRLREVLCPDFSQLEMFQKDLVGDVYFCCLGTTLKKSKGRDQFFKIDHDAIYEFAKIAQACQAQAFVLVSALRADPQSLVFYNRVKGQTEEDLKRLHLKHLVILRPGLLLGKRHEFRLFEFLFIQIVNGIKSFFHRQSISRWATDVELLVDEMIRQSVEGLDKNLVVVEAAQIMP